MRDLRANFQHSCYTPIMPRHHVSPEENFDDSPRLYGIYNSNRGLHELWGKNQFNSTFPAALACYMRDKNVPAVYLTLSKDLAITTSEISIDKLFGTNKPNKELRFDFETKFQPYEQYSLDGVGNIDLVIRNNDDDDVTGWLRALEVKLTVIPDETTCTRPETEWSPELVIRPASTKYCALGIYHSCRDKRAEIREIFLEICGNFNEWNSKHELQVKKAAFLDALNHFQKLFRDKQQPFLIQPLWKTRGKSPLLAENAFDLLVWSDFALCRIFIKALEEDEKINRSTRAAARFARMLYMLSTQERINLTKIYTEMAYGLQTDKEFSVPGIQTRKIIETSRRHTPILKQDVISKIILNGGQKLLSPERRFDATISFTANAIFDERTKEKILKITTSNS